MTRRRGSGEDSVYRDGDRWRGAVSLGYDEHDNRVRKKVSGRTRAEVTEKLRKLHQQVDSGVVPDDRLTVRAFLDRWLTVNLPGSVAESTEDDYVDTVRLHLVPALGRKPLAKLTVADLDRLWKAKEPLPEAERGSDLGALGGTRTPNLLIRSKIRFVQIRPSSSKRPAGTPRGDMGVPALSALVQVRC
jgi:integrase-like protein